MIRRVFCKAGIPATVCFYEHEPPTKKIYSEVYVPGTTDGIDYREITLEEYFQHLDQLHTQGWEEVTCTGLLIRPDHIEPRKD